MKQVCPHCGQEVVARVVKIVDDARLTHHERRIANLLASHIGKVVTYNQLLDCLYNDDPSGGPEKAGDWLKSYVSRLRHRLKDTGLVIENVYRDGYRLRWRDA